MLTTGMRLKPNMKSQEVHTFLKCKANLSDFDIHLCSVIGWYGDWIHTSKSAGTLCKHQYNDVIKKIYYWTPSVSSAYSKSFFSFISRFAKSFINEQLQKVSVLGCKLNQDSSCSHWLILCVADIAVRRNHLYWCNFGVFHVRMAYIWCTRRSSNCLEADELTT